MVLITGSGRFMAIGQNIQVDFLLTACKSKSTTNQPTQDNTNSIIVKNHNNATHLGAVVKDNTGEVTI